MDVLRARLAILPTQIAQVVPLVPEEFDVAALRLLFDISFFVIVTTIGLNIVFGIIVDTFSELRDERVRGHVLI